MSARAHAAAESTPPPPGATAYALGLSKTETPRRQSQSALKRRQLNIDFITRCHNFKKLGRPAECEISVQMQPACPEQIRHENTAKEVTQTASLYAEWAALDRQTTAQQHKILTRIAQDFQRLYRSFLLFAGLGVSE